MTDLRLARAVQIACWASILAVGLMTWSLLDPRPVPVVLAMSVGQVLGTLSLVTFLGVVALDLRKRMRVD